MTAQYRQPSEQDRYSHEGQMASMSSAAAILPAVKLRVLRRVLITPTHKLMQGGGNLVGIRCAPGNNALELDGIVCDGADFHQLGFNDLRVSHRNSSMAHVGTRKTVRWAGRWMPISI